MTDREAGDNGGPPPPERRRARRHRVLKRGQLIFGFGGSVIDCLILDESGTGVQTETAVMIEFPERLQLRYGGNAVRDVTRLWAVGTRAGLGFLGNGDEEAERQCREAAGAALRSQGLPAAMRLLREQGFCRSAELQQAAEAAELALARLNALLE